MESLKLYWRYLRISVRGQMAYKASFYMLIGCTVIFALTDFIALYILFGSFGGIGNWTLAEVMLFYGMANVSFPLCEAWMRGFDDMDILLKSGEFDRVMLRPRSTVLQMLGAKIQLVKVGRLTVGLCVLIVAKVNLAIRWNLLDYVLLLTSIVGGVLLFGGFLLMRATCCFWTIESLEVFNSFTYGGVETIRYPLDVYGDHLRRFFTFVVPLAAINYFPASLLLRRYYVPVALSWLAPLIGCLFFVIGLGIWKVGLKKYGSSGS